MARKKKRSKKDFSVFYVLIGVVFGAGLLGLGYLIGSSIGVEPVVETVARVKSISQPHKIPETFKPLNL